MDPDAIEATEVILMQIVVDAIEHMPAAQRDLTLARMLTGENVIGIELREDCLTISLFGEQIWSGTPHLSLGLLRGEP